MINIEKHAQGLLERLGQGDASVADYLEQNRIDIENGNLIVEYLVVQGLANDYSTSEGADCRLTGPGMVEAQRLIAQRNSPARRIGALRTGMLAWLDANPRVPNWKPFLNTEAMSHPGKDFTPDEVDKEIAYLHEHGLFEGQVPAAGVRKVLNPRITSKGRDCLLHHEGDVRSYLDRNSGATTNHTTHNNTNITMTDSVGNIVNSSTNVRQNINSDLDVAAVLKFAGAVSQALPVLNLDQDTQRTADVQAQELHEEASAASPDPSRMRTMIRSLLETLKTGANTAILEFVTGLGMQALEALPR
ncbi:MULTISPECIES: hypothetical protein [Actinosynnema]|uniref:hypothetical protein n=1 Tax=Actinosynnema TaxID=40566 RepID=UPI0020A253D1|nr:hypothetical protein [Actinosynnema pretiosum]MCP2097298.1 hypothetical protein [Actinosynnema pretiosum]